MLKIYGNARSRAFRVIWLCNESNIPYEHVPITINVDKAQCKEDWYVELNYVRYDNNSLSRGHVLVIPKRHVAGFFDMTADEQAAVLSLLNQAQRFIQKQHAPDGYNIGVNIGKAGGQSRMHVHVHLIPRYAGDVPDPQGGIRCVLAGKAHGA